VQYTVLGHRRPPLVPPSPRVVSLPLHRSSPPPAGTLPARHNACDAATPPAGASVAAELLRFFPPRSNLKLKPCSPCFPFPPQLPIKGRPEPPRARTEPCRPPLAPPRPRSTVELTPPPSPFPNRQHHQLPHPPLPLPSPAFPSPGRRSSTAAAHLRPPARPPVGKTSFVTNSISNSITFVNKV
jgi:hypothetical protein